MRSLFNTEECSGISIYSLQTEGSSNHPIYVFFILAPNLFISNWVIKKLSHLPILQSYSKNCPFSTKGFWLNLFVLLEPFSVQTNAIIVYWYYINMPWAVIKPGSSSDNLLEFNHNALNGVRTKRRKSPLLRNV